MLKVGDYVIIKRLIGDETINAKKSIGKAGKVFGISEEKSARYPIQVRFIKSFENCTELAYSEEELEKINEHDLLAYLI
ncbi:MAG: hypothetical protein IMZ52_02370 [Actinobacteria bacterium]|nr:hypothetical protein [Actinomycetota bacterium]MBE3114868.1 hypothetical protein [Actinomycetota bacterium]